MLGEHQIDHPRREDSFSPLALLPIAFYLTMTIPYWGQAPSLDAMVLYRESVQFFADGYRSLYGASYTVHPPLLYLLNALFFAVFGHSPASYSLAGTACFILASLSLFGVLRRHFGEHFAAIGTTLFFTSPPVVLNFFFPTNEALMVTGFVIALSLYVEDRRWRLAAFLPLFVLMKETALLVPATLAVVRFFEALIRRETLDHYVRRSLAMFTPTLVVFIAWRVFLHRIGATEWREQLFNVGTETSSYLVVLKSLVSFTFLNDFLKQNLRNAYVLNFQWLYVLIAFASMFGLHRAGFLATTERRRFFAVVTAFTGLYVLLVLSFPTWTLPRYALPATLLTYLLAGAGLSMLPSRSILAVAAPALGLLAVLANVASVDPVSSRYGYVRHFGEAFYDTPYANGGPDRVHYNLQFLRASAEQNRTMARALRVGADVLEVTDCNDFKLGEKLWSVSVHNEFYPRLPATRLPTCAEPGSAARAAASADAIVYREPAVQPAPMVPAAILRPVQAGFGF